MMLFGNMCRAAICRIHSQQITGLVDTAPNLANCEIWSGIDSDQSDISIRPTIFKCLQELQKSCCRPGRCGYHGGTAPPCYGEQWQTLSQNCFFDPDQTRHPSIIQ